jgi:hypothetical protein
MKKLLLFTLLIASTAIMAQPQLTWRFNNAQLIGDTQLQFDVEVKADAPGSYFGLATVAIEYDNTVWGSSLIGSGIDTTGLAVENLSNPATPGPNTIRGTLLLEASFLVLLSIMFKVWQILLIICFNHQFSKRMEELQTPLYILKFQQHSLHFLLIQ